MPRLQEESRKLRKISSAGLYFLRSVTAEAIPSQSSARDLAAAEKYVDIAGRRQLTSEPVRVSWNSRALLRMLCSGGLTTAKSGRFPR